MSQIFKILFQTGDINIFVLRGVFFSSYVQLKSSLSVIKLRHTLVEKLSEINLANSSLAEVGALQSCSKCKLHL